jgi:hypothetical protein
VFPEDAYKLWQPEYELEFHPPHDEPMDIQVLQSQLSKKLGESPLFDHSNLQFHATGVGSKALGKQYGVAKKVCSPVS